MEAKLLKDYTVAERTAYLQSIVALATADRSASDDEQYFLEAIAESAELPQEQVISLLSTAGTPNGDDQLKQSLDTLKSSELRFSLMTDLMAFAQSDQTVTPEEKQRLEYVGTYLNINQQQLSTINQLVDKAATTDASTQDQSKPQQFLESLGLGNQFSNAGMNFGNISKGLLGMLAPLIMGKLMGRKNGGGGLGGGLGGLLGGLTGGSGSLGGTTGTPGSGGLGSIISMLNGGRGMGNIGGMLGRMFGK